MFVYVGLSGQQGSAGSLMFACFVLRPICFSKFTSSNHSGLFRSFFSKFFFAFKALSFPSDSSFFNLIVSSFGRFTFTLSLIGILYPICFYPRFNFSLCKNTWRCDFVVWWIYGNGDRGIYLAIAFDPAFLSFSFRRVLQVS